MSNIDEARHHGRWPKEEGMHEEEEQEYLPLKSGGQANVRHALIELDSLIRLLTTYPEHFKVLLNLARGENSAARNVSSDTARQESIHYLQLTGYVSKKEGTIRPLIRDLLLSGYQITPDGPAMTQPFLLATSGNGDIADNVQRQIEQSRSYWLSKMRDDRSDPPSR